MRRTAVQRGDVARAQRGRAGGGEPGRDRHRPDRLSPADRGPQPRGGPGRRRREHGAACSATRWSTRRPACAASSWAATSAFLDPYHAGVADARSALVELDGLARGEHAGDLRSRPGRGAARHRRLGDRYALPTMDRIHRLGAGAVEDAAVAEGKARFDAVRAALARLQGDLRADRADARADLATAGRHAHARADVRHGPAARRAAGHHRGRPPGHRGARSARLATQVRAVAGGALQRAIEPGGPSDIERLGADVESMRERIVAELEVVRLAEAEIQEKALALERSNAELEQFAYVASHDLQEPLRKVTSFCQMLERRYAGQLDERGEQYIAFAVDGAKRMQALINDLLAFSRVGRVERPRELVDLGELVAHTASALAALHRGDGRHRRGRRAPARGLRRADAARARAAEPDLQRHQVPIRRAAARARVGAPRRQRVGVRGLRQRDRDRAGVRRPHLHHLPAPARQGRLRGDRDRAGHVPQGHRAPWGHIWLQTSQNGNGSTFRFTLPVPDIATEEATP